MLTKSECAQDTYNIMGDYFSFITMIPLQRRNKANTSTIWLQGIVKYVTNFADNFVTLKGSPSVKIKW